MATISDEKKSPSTVNPYPVLGPRFWHGMPVGIWLKLLVKNRFRVSWSRMHMVVGVTLISPVNNVLGFLQEAIHGRAIKNTKMAGPPIFVLGHWRSGTTLMHELLALDDRFASPSTYQCFAPWHFLMSQGMMNRFGAFLLPKKRPMDNMTVSWQHPQEDEFAMLVLGAPTPYYRIAFPAHPIPYMDTMGSSTFSQEDLSSWKQAIDWFFKALTYHHQKPLIIKSPPHTGRLRLLAEMYPDAKFIHMIRDPRKLYPSTLKLWHALDEVQSLQRNTDEQLLHQYVIESLHRMYDAFELDRKVVGEHRIIDIHYEDLVRRPVEIVSDIYDRFDLGSSTAICESIKNQQADRKDYQTNQHSLDEATEKMILREWAEYAKKYGYL